MNINEFVVMKLKAQDEAMQAMTADELDEFAAKLFREGDRLTKSGLKNSNEDELRLAKKFKNSGSWAKQVMAVKRYA
jgi:hypothetical protein